MTRPTLPALFCLLPLATLVAGCSLQGGAADRRYDDLRSLVLEQRHAIDDLRREQESVRATLDQMQYGKRPPGRPVYGPTGGPTSTDDYWQRQGTAGPGEPGYGPTTPPSTATTPPSTATAPPAAAPAPAPTPSPTSEPEKPTVPPELVGSAYDSAMRELNSGDQDEAIQSFRNYLHENGSSPYADDAQFWIGESYFRKGQYHRAIIEFNQVSINYGSGDRAPAALLRQAEAFRIVGDRVDARLSLQKVINRYPGTGEAAKASRMLTEIGG
jgi:tol-pal system protein YbgF